MKLNKHLVTTQKLNSGDVKQLKKLHKMKEGVFTFMELLNPDKAEDLFKLREFVKVIESFEFIAQSVWNFTPSSKFHQWWIDCPHCKCPKMDNMDAVGADVRYFNGDCPLHEINIGEVTKQITPKDVDLSEHSDQYMLGLSSD